MTSLSHQLKKLKKASTQALAVERDYSSLIFKKQDAETYDRDDFYKIGLAGLAGMKKLDNDFDIYEPELFEKKMLKFNRAIIGKEESNELNQKIDKMLLRLSPYFHHQCCKEVLEWLIYKFQIHSYNAEQLFLTFLPFHEINSFGRLLNILKFNSPDLNWLEEYQKDALPIPHNILCRACQSGRSYWLITALTKFINNSIQLLDENYVNSKMQHYFTFLVSLFSTLIENRGPAMDDQLISRLVPFIGISLKSNLESFKYCGIMITCTLVINVSINDEIGKNLLKLLFHNFDISSSEIIFQTANVICERLELDKLPKRTILRLLTQNDVLQLSGIFQKLMSKYEIAAFLGPFWRILIDEIISEENDVSTKDFYTNFLIILFDLHRLSDRQAEVAFDLFLDCIENKNEEEIGKKIFPKVLRKHIKTMIIKFPNAFDGNKKRRRKSSIQQLMQECKISDYLVGN